MEGQQVLVTGADGEQMVISGPEAAALLAQAGISLGDNDQVIIGGSNEAGAEGGAGVSTILGNVDNRESSGEGIIQVPEGSSITEDGSIISADGTVLAPPGSVVMGEDGTLMMTPDGAMLMQGGQVTSEASAQPTDLTATSDAATGAAEQTAAVSKDAQANKNKKSEKSDHEAIAVTTGASVVGTSASDGVELFSTSAQQLIDANGSAMLTTEDGTSVALPISSMILQNGATNSELVGSTTAVSSEGGIVVSTAGGTIMSEGGSYLLQQSQASAVSAPEGSIVTEDGSVVAADGTVLAPPGSVVSGDQQSQQILQQSQQDGQLMMQQQTEAREQPQMPSGNLIGLQLPDDNGEVLYLDPNDPAAQILLQEAGITLGEGGVLQTADGQILTNGDGDPITSNLKPTASQQNNLVGDAVAAAGLVPEELAGFQLPTSSASSTQHIDLPLQQTSSVGATDLTLNTGQFYQDEPSQKQTSRFSSANQQLSGHKAGQSKFQKLTFNNASGTTGTTRTISSTTQVKKQSLPTKPKTGLGSEMQIGPDQQKVTYTVTSENGYTQTYMMICSKNLDQNTLINTLIKNISNDPNHKGKKTIKITQHKYGTKKKTPGSSPANSTANRTSTVQQTVRSPTKAGDHLRSLTQTKTQYRAVSAQQGKQQSHLPPQQILQSEVTDSLMTTDNLSLDDLVNQIGSTAGQGLESQESNDLRVIVKCVYCNNFRSPLNTNTWENILNHILPVAREELHASFYGNILKNFSRGLKVGVSAMKGIQVEVTVTHGLICRRTGTWYSVDQPGLDLAIRLATHIAAVQPGITGPYGARPRGNSLTCLFCTSPYTAEDYKRHLEPHVEYIIPCLLLAAGAYCATSFEVDIKKSFICQVCHEPEFQDLRFLPCVKFAPDFLCIKRLQGTVDCFRENFDSRGFLQVSNSAMSRCTVCQSANLTYCALFKVSNHPVLHGVRAEQEMLAVCANCQKQFVNVVMRESAFDRQLKMFQLHHMEQLCGMLRVLLTTSPAVSNGSHHLIYTVQEGGTLYMASNSVHSVAPGKPLNNLTLSTRVLQLEENKTIDMSGPSIRFVCDQCKFAIDLTRLQHKLGKSLGHLVDMALSIVLEHIVPHTDSLLAVLLTAASNELFHLKYEFNASVERGGEGGPNNRRIKVSLDRKLVPVNTNVEISINKDIHKTIDALKPRLKQDKRGQISVKGRYIFLDSCNSLTSGPTGSISDSARNFDSGKFLEDAEQVIKLYGTSGCNTRLLDYYAECRLCAKFSFPDFRLTAAIKRDDGVSLCENCCETILSLCVPSEPERLQGRIGDTCLLLNQEKNTGHRLVLSNQLKKWISADGVEKIQFVNEVATPTNLPEYNSSLVQLLRSHLLAVCERSWCDPDCVAARAGFIIKDPLPSRINPIEVKVTQKPQKPRSPPAKLMITPVSGTKSFLSKTGSGLLGSVGKQTTKVTPVGSKLVKITANRRIIPVRDPTSTSLKPTPKDAKDTQPATQQKSATAPSKKVMAAGAATTTPAAPAKDDDAKAAPEKKTGGENNATPEEGAKAGDEHAAASAEAKPKEGDSEETAGGDGDADAAMPEGEEGEKDKETTPVKRKPKEGAKKTSKVPDDENEEAFETLEDIANFINSSDPTPEKGEEENAANNSATEEDGSNMFSLQDEFTDNSLKLTSEPAKYYKLPKGTIVSTVSSTSATSSHTKSIINSKAGVSKAGTPARKIIELGASSVTKVGEPPLPSPASDATTSTRSTPAPLGSLRGARGGIKSGRGRGAMGARSVGSTPKSSVTSSAKRGGRGRPPKSSAPTSISYEEAQAAVDKVLDDLDLDCEALEAELLDGLDDEEDKTLVGGLPTAPVATDTLPGGVSATTPQVKMVAKRGRKLGTPASSSRKGLDKRKLSDVGETPSSMKKTKFDTPEPEKEDEVPEYLKGVSLSGRVRKAKKMFNL